MTQRPEHAHCPLFVVYDSVVRPFLVILLFIGTRAAGDGWLLHTLEYISFKFTILFLINVLANLFMAIWSNT